MKKLILITLFFYLLVSVSGCFGKSSNSAEQLIYRHFQYIKEKDEVKLNSTMSERMIKNGWNYDFDNVIYIKNLTVKEDKETNIKKTYMTNGHGSVLKPHEVKVYAVEYDIKYKDEKKSITGS